jgi:hypothetical protein
MQKGLEKWAGITAALVTIVGFPLLLGSLWFAYRLDTVISEQLGEIKRIAQSENSIALNTMLFNDTSNAGIISSIQNNKPILVQNGGSYSTVDLDKYLSAFNTVSLVYRDGFLSDDHLCSAFAFYVEEANENSEVNTYLAEYPKYFGRLPRSGYGDKEQQELFLSTVSRAAVITSAPLADCLVAGCAWGVRGTPRVLRAPFYFRDSQKLLTKPDRLSAPV